MNDLELDPLFREWAERPLFGAITRHYYDQDVAIFRAFMMNKPKGAGTPLEWHQDVGEGWGIDSLPTLTRWGSSAVLLLFVRAARNPKP